MQKLTQLYLLPKIDVADLLVPLAKLYPFITISPFHLLFIVPEFTSPEAYHFYLQNSLLHLQFPPSSAFLELCGRSCYLPQCLSLMIAEKKTQLRNTQFVLKGDTSYVFPRLWSMEATYSSTESKSQDAFQWHLQPFSTTIKANMYAFQVKLLSRESP